MTQPILTIKPDESKAKAVANLLPCRIHHNGPVDPSSQYWKPTTADDGSKTTHFRGRKLQGKTIQLPEQCRGVVLERRDDAQPAILDEEELRDPVGTMRVTAEFEELVVWGHESVAEAGEDAYVRSMEEWLQVADKIHSYEREGEK